MSLVGCFQRQFEDLEAEIEGLADLVDRRAAGLEIGDHLGGDRRRIGGDALLHHAMIAGEDRDHRALDARRMAALPARQPFGDLFEPAERARRLGQPRVAGADRGAGLVIGPRHVVASRRGYRRRAVRSSGFCITCSSYCPS